MGEQEEKISDTDGGGLKELKITKRTQKQHSMNEIENNTVSLTFSSPFGKQNAGSRNSSRQTSRPTSKRSSKRISGFDLLENISMTGLMHSATLTKTMTNKSSNDNEKSEISDYDNHNAFKKTPMLNETLQVQEELKSDTPIREHEEMKSVVQIEEEKDTSAEKFVDKEIIDHLNMSPVVNDDGDSSNDSFGWENMDAVANHTVYDENGKLQVLDADVQKKNDQKLLNQHQRSSSTKIKHQFIDDNDEEIICDIDNSKMFAYTKIDGEEQARASRKTNAKIDSLIASATIYQRSGKKSTSIPATTEQCNANSDHVSDENEDENKKYEFDDDNEDDANITHEDLTKQNQLSGMKQLLTDNEKFAYAGCVFLLLNQLCADLATRNLNSNMIKDPKLAKRLHNVQKSYGYWKEEIMTKIFYHMAFNEDEVKMIENLGLFPLEIDDLMKALKIQRKVINPYNDDCEHLGDLEEKKEALKVSSMRTVDDPDLVEKVPENVISIDQIKHEKELEVDVPWSVICDLFLLFLSKGNYDARSRVILKQFADHLNITNEEVNQFEKRITETLELEQSDQQRLSREDLLKKRRQLRKRKKMAYVGLATVGGSLVLGLSGGLLAPVIGAGVAAGLSTVGVTGLSGFLTGVGGTATVAATSTAIGANIGGSSMSRRMGSVKTFEFKPLYNNRRLNLIISVSGWMTGAEDDVRLPFSTLDPVEGDLYSLHWEPDILKSTGDTMNILASEAITQTIQQVLGATILTAFMGAIQLPMALSKLGYLIDNPWNVSLDRAWNSGLILAEYLIEKDLGDRPITLLGFSLGSRVIYYCLKELCKRGATGIVENVVILGAPVVYDKDEMVMCRSVVAGRFVNGYSEKDWILGYLFRATAGGISTVAGLSPIESEGIENFDCSEIVNGHMGYRKNIPKILKELGFSTLSDDFIEIDDKPDPDREKKQKELLDTLKKLDKDDKKKKSSSWIPKWMKPKKEEWQEMVKQDVVDENRKLSENTEINADTGSNSEIISKAKQLNLSISSLQSTDEYEPSSLISQEGETFSLKLNNRRPRFASGNVGFVLKNAGRAKEVFDGGSNLEAKNKSQENKNEIQDLSDYVEQTASGERQTSVVKTEEYKNKTEENDVVVAEDKENEIVDEIKAEEKDEKEVEDMKVDDKELKQKLKNLKELKQDDLASTVEKITIEKLDKQKDIREAHMKEILEPLKSLEVESKNVESSPLDEILVTNEDADIPVSNIKAVKGKSLTTEIKLSNIQQLNFIQDLQKPILGTNETTSPRISLYSDFVTAEEGSYNDVSIDNKLSKDTEFGNVENTMEYEIKTKTEEDKFTFDETLKTENGIDKFTSATIEDKSNNINLCSDESNINLPSNAQENFEFVKPLSLGKADSLENTNSLQTTSSAEYTGSEFERPSIESNTSIGSKKQKKAKKRNRKRK
ncbi:hypothetical protein QEN19_003844 [Hanseniaspora menglaensis]